MRSMWRRGLKSVILAAIAFALAPSCGRAEIYRFDFGTAQSPVQAGYARVTPEDVAGANLGGWVVGHGVVARDRPYETYETSRRGQEPPPCFTNPLTEDCLMSDRPAEFVARVPDGSYHAWVLCGTSDSSRRQFFDFDVTSGAATRRVQFEEGPQFRHIFLDVAARGGEARLKLAPRSKFSVCGVVLWQEADKKQFESEILRPIRDLLEFLPPAEAAKWKQVQPVDGTPWPKVAASDRKRGYLVHQRHWAEVVYPDTVPLAPEINPQLRAFASPGEYEPLSLIIYPFRELAGARVTVSDLKCPAGVIPSGACEVRRVKYMRVRPNYTTLGEFKLAPDPLMPIDPDETLPAKENTRYWLTLHVPETARPGRYRGTVTFAPRGAPAARISLQVRVLPIKLQEDPSKLYAIYYYDPLDKWADAADEVSRAYFLRKSEWELADMAAHGTRNVVSGLWAAPEKPGEPGEFSFNFDLFQKKLDLWKRYGFKGPVVVQVNAAGIYRKYVGKSLGAHLGEAAPPPPEYGAELTRMCQAIEAERQRRGWPEFLYYPIDEPSTSPGAIAFMVETLKAVRAAGVKTYVTADPTLDGFAPLKPYTDVWCTQPFLPARGELLQEKAARQVDFWCYPNHVNGENDHTPVNGARMTYGFGFWRSGFTALIPWIYQANMGDPWNYLSGDASDFFNRSEDSGRPIPVAMWEAYREGYDDYRYVYTCQQLIAAGQQQGGRAAEAAREAQSTLDYVWGQIRVQAKYKYDDLWEPREIDVYRWLVADQILKLQAAGVR